jgi:extradiol dioxygenase family protein
MMSGLRPLHLAVPVHNLALAQSFASISFVIEPRVRFRGKTGEQATMFFMDPSGNSLEFKAFGDDSQISAS